MFAQPRKRDARSCSHQTGQKTGRTGQRGITAAPGKGPGRQAERTRPARTRQRSHPDERGKRKKNKQTNQQKKITNQIKCRNYHFQLSIIGEVLFCSDCWYNRAIFYTVYSEVWVCLELWFTLTVVDVRHRSPVKNSWVVYAHVYMFSCTHTLAPVNREASRHTHTHARTHTQLGRPSFFTHTNGLTGRRRVWSEEKRKKKLNLFSFPR